MSFQNVLPLGKIIFYCCFIHFSILKINTSLWKRVIHPSRLCDKRCLITGNIAATAPPSPGMGTLQEMPRTEPPLQVSGQAQHAASELPPNTWDSEGRSPNVTEEETESDSSRRCPQWHSQLGKTGLQNPGLHGQRPWAQAPQESHPHMCLDGGGKRLLPLQAACHHCRLLRKCNLRGKTYLIHNNHKNHIQQ